MDLLYTFLVYEKPKQARSKHVKEVTAVIM